MASKRRAYPYCKVQLFNETSVSWKDIAGAFDSLEDAQNYIAEKCQGKVSRIMVVEERRRYVFQGEGK